MITRSLPFNPAPFMPVWFGIRSSCPTEDRTQRMAKRSHPPNPNPHNTPLATSVGLRYIIKADHRAGGSSRKSQWVISEREEVQCFEHSQQSNWIDNASAW